MNAPFPMLTGKGGDIPTLVIGALVMWAVVAAMKKQQSSIPTAPPQSSYGYSPFG